MSDAPVAASDRLAALCARVAAARADCESDAAVLDADLRWVAALPGGECKSALRKLAANGASLRDLERRIKVVAPASRRGGFTPRVVGEGEGEPDWRELLKYSSESNEPRGTLDNALHILRHAYVGRLSYDLMGLQPCLDGRPLDDSGITRLRGEVGARAEAGGHNCTVQVGDFRAAVIAVAEEQRAFSPVADHLRGIEWDRKPRLWTMARDHLLLPDAYSNRALGRVWVSAAARALVWEDNPAGSAELGVMVKTIPITLGWQDAKKSTMWRVMGGRWFGDTGTDIEDPKRSTMVLGSCWIYEFPEIDGLLTRGNNEHTKSWTGSSVDRMVPNFSTSVLVRPRSFVVVGTTNKPRFLTDPTGSARWWVFDLRPHGEQWEVDEEKLAAERDQILAEAVYELDLYRSKLADGKRGDANPHRWWMSKAENKERAARNEAHQVEHGWSEVLAAWLAGAEVQCVTCRGTGGRGNDCAGCTGSGHVTRGALAQDASGREYVTLERLRAECLGVPVERWKTRERGEVSDALAALHWLPGPKPVYPRGGDGRALRSKVTPFYYEGPPATAEELTASGVSLAEAMRRLDAIGKEAAALESVVERAPMPGEAAVEMSSETLDTGSDVS